MLHAKGRVDGLSVINVISKVIWAGGIALSITLAAPIWWFAAAFLASEGVKAAILYALARKHLALKLRLDFKATKQALILGSPFFLVGAAQVIYSKIDLSFLAVVAGDHEVGLYAAASNIGGLTLLVTPLIGWVLLPLLSRAAQRSEEEFNHLARRSTELILAIAIPTSLAMEVGADVWLALLFGPKYASSALALRILAPMFVLTYLAIICTCVLNLKTRGWITTAIAVGGLIVSPILNFLLIRPSIAFWNREGGGGAGCAVAMVLTELAVTAAMLYFVGRRTFDRRVIVMVVKSLAVCVVVVALDWWIASIGPVRLVVDAVVYVVLALAIGAVNLQELTDFARSSFRRRREGAV